MRHPNPPPPPEFAVIQHKEALALKVIADLNKAREGAGLPRVRLDLVADRCPPRESDVAEFWADRLTPGQSEPAAAASYDRPPELLRDPREVADILRNVLGSIEFTAKAIAMAEAVDGYRFAESTQLSDSGFVQERVAMLWCIGVLDGEIGGAAPARWRIPAYYKASS